MNKPQPIQFVAKPKTSPDLWKGTRNNKIEGHCAVAELCRTVYS